MPRRDAVENALEQLEKIRDDPRAASSITTLRTALAGKSSHVAAKAAKLAGEFELEMLARDMVAAFDRLLINPVKSDPGCAGKTAIADALYRIGTAEAGIFRRGIRHVQMEPVYGGKADTAVELRGACALGLVRMHHPDGIVEIAELLADREAPARRMAARALAYAEDPAAAPLLRLKALVGDDEPQVLGECLLALLAIAPVASIEFVARFLDRPPELAEAAALALGGSRVKEALPILIGWWERTFDPTLRRSALLAIAMLKQDEAIEFLLSLVGDGAAMHAGAAIRGLALYRHDPKLRARVAGLVEKRDEKPVREAFEQEFGEIE